MSPHYTIYQNITNNEVNKIIDINTNNNMNQSTALSTKFASDYKVKEKPKNVKIEINNSYLLSDGQGGTRQVKIVSIRNLDGEIVIYFKWRRSNSGKFIDFLTGGSWINDQRTLGAFKAQLLQFGQMNEIELVYNDKKPNFNSNQAPNE